MLKKSTRVLTMLVLLLATPSAFADDDLAEVDQNCLDAWNAEEYIKVGFHCKAGVKRDGPISQYVWGLSKRKKKPTAKSNREAHRLLLLSAEQGDAPANTALGRLYQTGQGVDRDFCKAEAYFGEAAKAGDLPAHRLLGESLLAGLCSNEQDYEGALPFLMKCANYDAETRGLIGITVISAQNDYIEGRSWLKAAELGGSTDENILGALGVIDDMLKPDAMARSEARVEAIVADVAANPVDCKGP